MAMTHCVICQAWLVWNQQKQIHRIWETKSNLVWPRSRITLGLTWCLLCIKQRAEREDFKEDVKEIKPVMPQKQLNREKRDWHNIESETGLGEQFRQKNKSKRVYNEDVIGWMLNQLKRSQTTANAALQLTRKKLHLADQTSLQNMPALRCACSISAYTKLWCHLLHTLYSLPCHLHCEELSYLTDTCSWTELPDEHMARSYSLQICPA